MFQIIDKFTGAFTCYEFKKSPTNSLTLQIKEVTDESIASK